MENARVIGSNVKARREQLGYSQEKLAKLVGTKQQNIQQLEADVVSQPRYLSRLLRVLGCTYEQLEAGQFGVRELSDAPEYRIKTVPLISWITAGSAELAIDLFAPGDADEWLPCPVPHSPSTFALRVEGDSMTAPSGKSFPAGIDIFVDPEQRGGCGPGDFVVAKINGQDAVTFKQIATEEGRLYLRPLNPRRDPIFQEFRVLGKVVYAGFRP